MGTNFLFINNADEEMLEARKNEQVVEVSHINFVFGDQQ